MRHLPSFAHALPLDDRLFREPFYVTHAGCEHVLPGQSYPRPGHPSYYGFTWTDGRVLGEFCLVMIVEGQGELETPHGLQTVQAGEGFLYQPGEWHRHRPGRATGWVNRWINFNGSLAHQWMHEGAFALEKNLVRVRDAALFRAQFEHLVETVHAAGARNSPLFSWHALGVVAHFLREAPRPGGRDLAAAATPRSTDPLMEAAMDYIWSQSHNQIGVTDVARATGQHRRTLERRFKAARGATLLEEIHRCRISRAALLLRETQAPIKYILGRAGFASYQQQRRAFQKQFGVSPEAYRAGRGVAEAKPSGRTV